MSEDISLTVICERPLTNSQDFENFTINEKNSITSFQTNPLKMDKKFQSIRVWI